MLSVYVTPDTSEPLTFVYPLPLVVLRYTLYPETVEVLAVQFSVTLCVAGCTPVPDNEIVFGEPVALLVTVTVPELLPAADGPKVTLNVKVWFGVSVTGVLAPVSVNPLPLSLICVICTLALPVLVTVTGNCEEVPVFTFPKARLEVLNESVSVAATPVPFNATVAGEFGALLLMLMLPVAEPAGLSRGQ